MDVEAVVKVVKRVVCVRECMRTCVRECVCVCENGDVYKWEDNPFRVSVDVPISYSHLLHPHHNPSSLLPPPYPPTLLLRAAIYSTLSVRSDIPHPFYILGLRFLCF